jgi:hypothetical protein
LYAAKVCASLQEQQLDVKCMKPNACGDIKAAYQYLGPNCCRIGKTVSEQKIFL